MKTRITSFCLLVALCGSALLFSACGTDYGTPEATLNTFAEAMQNLDSEAIVDCYVQDEQAKAREEFDNDSEQSNTTIVCTPKGVKKEDGYTIGSVDIKEEGKDGSFEMKVYFVEEEGAWKISQEAYTEHMLKKIEQAKDGVGE